MSKAFTREDDDAPEQPVAARPASALPPGAKNYLTPAGEQRLRAELDQVLITKHTAASLPPENNDTKRRLQSLDQRIAQLQNSLQSAVIVPPPAPPHDTVRFGATVKVRNRRGEESRYRIVGVDETDLDRDEVSWLSPIAKALLNAKLGQRVKFRFPAGEDELEIIRITY
jgi:transcription elongation factor GreB